MTKGNKPRRIDQETGFMLDSMKKVGLSSKTLVLLIKEIKFETYPEFAQSQIKNFLEECKNRGLLD